MMKRKFFYISRRKMYFYLVSIMVAGYRKVLAETKRWFINPLDLLIVFRNDEEAWWYPDDLKLYKKIGEFYSNRPEEILNFISFYKKRRDQVLPRIKNILKKLPFLDKKQLIENLSSLFKLFVYDAHMVSVARRLDIFLFPRFKDGLSRQLKTTDSKIDEIIASLIKSPYDSYILEEQKIFWKNFDALKKKGLHKNKKLFNAFLDKHLNNYSWVGLSYYNEPPLAKKDLLLRIKKGERPAPERAENKKLLRSLPKKLRKQTLCLIYASYLKDFARAENAKTVYFIEPFLRELSRRFKIPLLGIKSYTFSEIERLVKTGKKIPKPELQFRQRFSVIFKNKIYTGKRARQMEKQWCQLEYEEKESFTGRIACTGIARGRVAVAQTPDDLKNINNWSILVVNNTNPAFVPYLKKVKGIVAEEGGITTHVSLIAREFKIPAVVGIPLITRVLKNGDFVEVDADKGIIKIIK